MTYFISGHRDITPEEFEKFYVPAIVDVIDTCNDNYDDCEFVVGDCRGCDEMAANFIANYIKENTDDTEVCLQNRGSTSLRLTQLRVLLMKTQDM